MNNANMWLVVKPTVGIPVFLGAVAVGSFAVHVAVLTNTGWVSDFLTGKPLGSTAAIEAPVDGTAKVMFQETETSRDGVLHKATITLPDGRTGTVTFDMPPTKDGMVVAAKSPGVLKE